MINKQSSCETFAPLISAMIDGELESNERIELNSHLQNCASCKQRVIDFGQVDAAVDCLSHHSAGYASLNGASIPTMPFAMHSPKKPPPRKHRQAGWRLIPFAAAAMLLICLGIAVWPNPRPANAELISTAQIVEPMKQLHLLNLEKQRDQDLMLRTLRMDLRSLKLELNRLEPGSVQRVSFATQIDAMIEKVKLFETTTFD